LQTQARLACPQEPVGPPRPAGAAAAVVGGHQRHRTAIRAVDTRNPQLAWADQIDLICASRLMNADATMAAPIGGCARDAEIVGRSPCVSVRQIVFGASSMLAIEGRFETWLHMGG
jgi:hypothetical protein